MTTADVFLLLAGLFLATAIYFFRGRRISSSRAKLTPGTLLPWTYRPAAVLALVLAGLSIVIAIQINSSTVSLPERDETGSLPEGGRFPLPAPLEVAPEDDRPDPVAELRHQRALEAELFRLNDVLKTDPHDAISFGDRGAIYAEQKQWVLAENDFRSALNIDNKMAKAAFDLAEMEFQQKHYDTARPGFAALEKDPNLGDLATYKVFLCDLLGNHEDAAQKELDDLNHGITDASYYYANIAWLIYTHHPLEARQWLDSATYIYDKPKAALYETSLRDLGYLPLPAPKQ